MFGEKAIENAVVALIEKNPSMIVRIARDGMTIQSDSYVNDDGFVVITAEVMWFGETIDKTETVLPVKATG